MKEYGREDAAQSSGMPGGSTTRGGPESADWNEHTIAALWSEALDGQPVKPEDDLFFDLDGNSLLAVAITARLADRTGLPLELRDLYLSPTPRDLAGYLAELRGRLDDLRSRSGAAGWSAEAFVEALADLGAAAADSLLPAQALVSVEPDGPGEVRGAARVAVLRKARGNGTCAVKPGPVLALSRQDATVEVHVERRAGHLVVRLVEAARGRSAPATN